MTDPDEASGDADDARRTDGGRQMDDARRTDGGRQMDDARRTGEKPAGDGSESDDDAESTGPLARVKTVVTEAVGVVVNAVLEAI